MRRPTARHARLLVTAIAAALAVVDLSAIILLISGAEKTVRLGFRMLRPLDVYGAAQVGILLSGIVVILGWPNRVVRVVAIAGVILFADVVYSGSARATFPIGDGALIESYSLLATQGKLLLGPYSRFGWHHPGPLYFWMAAPLYALAGFKSAGLQIAVQCVNLSAMIVIAWIAARFASPQLIGALLAATGLYCWRAREIVVSLWNPHVPILPAAALIATAAAIAAGEVTLIPLAAVLASFIAQTHVALLPYAAVLSLLAMAVTLTTSRVGRGVWIEPKTRRLLHLTAWLLVILWSGPLAEQMAHSPGNLTRLWNFFREATPTHGPTEAFVAWADNIAGVFLGGFRFNGGGPFRPSTASWPLVYAPFVTVLLVPSILLFIARKQRFDAMFAGMTLVGVLTGFWSITRVVDLIPAYGIVWMSATGALAAGTVAAAAITYFIRGRTLTVRPAWAVNGVCIGFAIVYFAIVSPLSTSRFGRLSREERQVKAFSEDLLAYLAASGIQRPLFRIGPDMWAMTTGIGLQMQLADHDFAVEKQALFLFTDQFAPNGTEDALVTISPRPDQGQPVVPADGTLVSADKYIQVVTVPLTPYTMR
jgi:hypothetical protein